MEIISVPWLFLFSSFSICFIIFWEIPSKLPYKIYIYRFHIIFSRIIIIIFAIFYIYLIYKYKMSFQENIYIYYLFYWKNTLCHFICFAIELLMSSLFKIFCRLFVLTMLSIKIAGLKCPHNLILINWYW